MKTTCLIKPQTEKICYGKVRENPDLLVDQNYEITQNRYRIYCKSTRLANH